MCARARLVVVGVAVEYNVAELAMQVVLAAIWIRGVLSEFNLLRQDSNCDR